MGCGAVAHPGDPANDLSAHCTDEQPAASLHQRNPQTAFENEEFGGDELTTTELHALIACAVALPGDPANDLSPLCTDEQPAASLHQAPGVDEVMAEVTTADAKLIAHLS